MRALLLAAVLAAPAVPARAQESYGEKGIYPVYESGREWLIFEKLAPKKKPGPLAPGQRLLVIGSAGSELFSIERGSATYGGACRGRKPLRLRAAILAGPRKAVGRPIIGIRVPPSFSLKGSRARYRALRNEVDDSAYERLEEPVKGATVRDAQAGEFRFRLDDEAAASFPADPRPEKIQMKIDFGSRVPLEGLADAFVLVEESQIGSSMRRCLRLANASTLLGDCVEMPRALMVETAGLSFVSYDPSGRGQPLLLAFTPSQPMWGDERWGFVLNASGPRLFLMDAMDVRCREGF